MDETGLRVPTDLYGATKAATEVYMMGFRQYYSKMGGPCTIRCTPTDPGGRPAPQGTDITKHTNKGTVATESHSPLGFYSVRLPPHPSCGCGTGIPKG